MARNPSSPATERPPRILWASAYCLLDSSSGAALTVRQMLVQLQARGYDIAILGATHFDSENGTASLQPHWATIQAHRHKLIDIRDNDGLLHYLLVTDHLKRDRMSSREESLWFRHYGKMLEEYRPDLVFFYGGQPLDLLFASEARAAGIPTAFYLANGNYHGKRWARDVNLILTDSQATARLYQTRSRITAKPIGAFIDPTKVIAETHHRQHVLFINPSAPKGALIVAKLAMMLEKTRPDIQFEVVESRGNWQRHVQMLTGAAGTPRDHLDNVILTPNTPDMRPIYGRARLLLAPSLWWESAGRVLVEAMLNGIPAITTNRGGPPEMVGEGGVLLTLPDECHEKPYLTLPGEAVMHELAETVTRFFDDEAFYAAYAERARETGQTRHHLTTSTDRLIDALRPWLKRGRAAERRRD